MKSALRSVSSLLLSTSMVSAFAASGCAAETGERPDDVSAAGDDSTEIGHSGNAGSSTASSQTGGRS